MKQVKVLGVSGSIVQTTDGPKKPIGNRVFIVGDYGFAHGDALYGHESANYSPQVETDGIPIINLDASDNLCYGFVQGESYRARSVNASAGVARRVFANDKLSAWEMSGDGIPAQADLVAGEVSDAVASGLLIYDAEVNADNELLVVVGNGGYLLTTNRDEYGNIIGQDTERAAQLDIYQGAAKIATLGGLINTLASELATSELSTHPTGELPEPNPSAGNPQPWVTHHAIYPVKSVVNSDGSYTISGRGDLYVSYYVPDYCGPNAPIPYTDLYAYRPIVRRVRYFWTITGGAITHAVCIEHDYPIYMFGADTEHYYNMAMETYGVNFNQWRYPLPDGYYYVYRFVVDYQDGSPHGELNWTFRDDASYYDFYTPGDVLIVTRAYISLDLNHTNVVQLKSGAYLLILATSLLLIKQGAASTLLSSAGEILNTRMDVTRKIYKINTVLQSVAAQI